MEVKRKSDETSRWNNLKIWERGSTAWICFALHATLQLREREIDRTFHKADYQSMASAT